MNNEERQHLETLLQLHRKNLHRLEVQAAQHGAGNAPLSLSNQIDQENEEIARIQTELATFSVQSLEEQDQPGFRTNPVSKPAEPLIIPEELTYSFADRYARLSASQRRILAFIEQESAQQHFVRQRVLENKFDRYSKGEVFYRLEQLYLLGFLERQINGHDQNGFIRFAYCLSDVYKKELL